MAIRVKHAPSAAAIGESAYTVGRGQRQERDIRLAYDVSLRQQALDLQERGQELGAERSAEQLALRADELEFRKEQDLAGREVAERRWNQEPSRQLQKGLQQQKLLEKNIAWQYDEGQKRELEKITTGVAWLRAQVSAGKWTAEQAEQAEQQLWQKYYSIIPLPVYDDQPKPQEMYNSRIVTDLTGARSLMNSKGDFVDVPGSISFKDYAKLRADVAKVFTTQIKEGKDLGKQKTDWDAVDKFVDETMVRYTKIQDLAAKTERELARRAQQERKEQEKLKEQKQVAADQERVEMQANLEANWKSGLARLEDEHVGKASQKAMRDFGKIFIDGLIDSGIEPEQAVRTFMSLWEKEYKKRGFFRDDVVPKPPKQFENWMEFEGAAPQAAPGKIKVTRETERVTMKAPNGQIYEVDRSEAKEAEEHGWVIL